MFLERKRAAVPKSAREGGVRGQGSGDLQEGAFEELDTAVDGITRFPELEMESQYAQEHVPFAGTHN